ncbi:MAG: hypothetical protein ACXAEU_23700 [Candidatus Hodarchaeales archaeon]
MKTRVNLVVILITLVTMIIATSPIGMVSATTGKDEVIYEASSEPLSYWLHENATTLSYQTEFIITDSWRSITYLLVPLILDTPGKINLLNINYNLESFTGNTILKRSDGFKLNWQFQGPVVIPLLVDQDDELDGFFNDHGFIYGLQLDLSFTPLSELTGWTCNLTVNPPILQTFNPIKVNDLPGTGTNTTGQALVTCFPASSTYSTPSVAGYHFETAFFIDTGDLVEGQTLEVEVKIDMIGGYSGVSRLKIASLDEKREILVVYGEQERYAFTVGYQANEQSLLACLLEVDITGMTITEKFILKPVVSASRIDPLPAMDVEGLIFSPIPSSLHLPLLIFSMSPIGLAAYRSKKERDKEKVVREE